MLARAAYHKRIAESRVDQVLSNLEPHELLAVGAGAGGGAALNALRSELRDAQRGRELEAQLRRLDEFAPHSWRVPLRKFFDVPRQQPQIAKKFVKALVQRDELVVEAREVEEEKEEEAMDEAEQKLLALMLGASSPHHRQRIVDWEADLIESHARLHLVFSLSVSFISLSLSLSLFSLHTSFSGSNEWLRAC